MFSSGRKFHIIVVDLAEGLPISNISRPHNIVLEWITHFASHIETLLDLLVLTFMRILAYMYSYMK